MEFFIDHRLNPQAFETDIRQGTHDLADVLAAAVKSGSARIESTHFLMAMAGIRNGATRKFLSQMGLSTDQWESGLSETAAKSSNELPPPLLSKDAMHESAANMLGGVESYCRRHGLARVSEPVLLLCAIGNLTRETADLFRSAGIDTDAWRGEIELTLMPADPIRPFRSDASQAVEPDLFSPAAKKVLLLMKGEAESMGFSQMDPRHLAMALLTREGGATPLGLFQQGLKPRKVQEVLALNLKAKAKRVRSEIPLDRNHCQPMLQRIFALAGELAGRDHAPRITEAHLLRAFLETESMARHIMEDEGVKLARLKETAENFDSSTEAEEEEQTLADIDTVRQRLLSRLVGQDAAIERILPAVQRMQFGFAMPERPVGVFMFCGQSGSGKTEMAKELARAVYGSEENLIFLEMGQFNSPESMNIFVGAPPGYVGYGEGKLTNGLRDKPRSVVLFDEVEKAHARVMDALLRFLDEGRIDDPAGPVRDGSHCIVILTSNVGSESLSEMAKELDVKPEGQSAIRKRLREEFKRKEFRVEFLNRVDELILFRTLNQDDYTAIAARLFEKTAKRMLDQKQVTIVAGSNPGKDGIPDVARAIGAYCVKVDEGARAAVRMIQSVVVTPAIDYILKNRIVPPAKIKVRAIYSPDRPEVEPRGVAEKWEDDMHG